MRDDKRRTNKQTVKIELLSQWKLEAEFRNSHKDEPSINTCCDHTIFEAAFEGSMKFILGFSLFKMFIRKVFPSRDKYASLHHCRK